MELTMAHDPEFKKLVRVLIRQSGMSKQAVEDALRRLLEQGDIPEEVIYQFNIETPEEKTHRLDETDEGLFRRTLELLSEWGFQTSGLKKAELQELRFKLIELTTRVEQVLDEEF